MDFQFCKLSSEAIAAKIKTFKKYLAMGQDCIINRNYVNAQMIFGGLLTDLNNSDFMKAIDLNELEYFSIHCCLLYTQLHIEHKLDTEDTLFMINKSRILANHIQLPLGHFMRASMLIEIEMVENAKEEMKLCESLLLTGYNFKPNWILNEQIVPELNDACLKEELKKLFYVCDFTNWASGLKAEAETKKPQTGKNKAKSAKKTVATQTIAPKRTDSFAQTVKTKEEKQGKPAANNQDGNKKLMEAVNEIKNKVNSMQSKKDVELKEVQKENRELREKMEKVELEHRMQEYSFDGSKEHCRALQAELDARSAQVRELQQVLTQQVQHKQEMQYYIYNMHAERCMFRMNYYREILEMPNSLVPGLLQPGISHRMEYDKWRASLADIEQKKERFQRYYCTLIDSVVSGPIRLVNGWPSLHNLPKETDDLIYKLYKRSIGENCSNLATNRDMSPSPCDDTRTDGAIKRTRLKTKIKEPYIIIPPPMPISAKVEETPANNEVELLKAREVFACPKAELIGHDYNSEKELFDFVRSKFSNVDEMKLLQVIFWIRESNGGMLYDVPKEQLVKQIGKCLKENTLKKSWSNLLNKPMCDSDDYYCDDIKCIICFEEMKTNNIRTLQCKHKFHRKCINNWLKQQSVCPFCRVRVVDDADFPPLKV